MRGPASFDRQSLDQRRVHVRADADREDPRVATLTGGNRRDRVGVALTDRRLAVRQEDDERQPLTVGPRTLSASSSAPEMLVEPSARSASR